MVRWYASEERHRAGTFSKGTESLMQPTIAQKFSGSPGFPDSITVLTVEINLRLSSKQQYKSKLRFDDKNFYYLAI